MTKLLNSQSQKRFQESLGGLFSESSQIGGNTCLILKSSTDIGVIRNGGRNGARFAPQSFLASFKKLTQNKLVNQFTFVVEEVGNIEEEKADFHLAQKQEAQRISHNISKFPDARICHIGGGHDHIYPLLTALSKNHEKVIVINVDAHADTRSDENFHSGTPFRQFANDYPGSFFLYQIGLAPYANSFSTMVPLERGQSRILWRDEVNSANVKKLFTQIKDEVDANTLVVFSLDADALAGSEVPGVSAVNPAGLARADLMEIWELYLKLPTTHKPILGIYELNPIYDTLASLSMRTIASFVFESFRYI